MGSSGSSSAASLPLDAFSGATKRVEVSQGQVLGVTLTMIDTPGLTASAAGAAANAAVLRKLRKAFQQHEPDLVLYVDRWVLLAFARDGFNFSTLTCLHATAEFMCCCFARARPRFPDTTLRSSACLWCQLFCDNACVVDFLLAAACSCHWFDQG
jgi:hypothetical protein